MPPLALPQCGLHVPIRLVVEHKLGKNKMKALGVTSFKKTAVCPSETILISYQSKKLSQEIMTVVRFHLGSCDFCAAELPLLSYYSQPQRGECRAPDIPMDLRILAESLLFRHRRRRPQISQIDKAPV